MRLRLSALCLMLYLIGGTHVGWSGEVVLSGADLFQVGSLGWIAPRLALPPPAPSLPIMTAKADDPGVTFLLSLAASHRAAGLGGVLYDNRDRGHSTLPDDLFPGLARLTYAPDLRDAGLDYGLGGSILLPAIVLGNSSTAIRGGPMARSLPRLAMTTEDWPQRSFRAYAANHIYVYPEHRDHDAVDLYPANWPYMVISQGSSGSDRPFLRAIAMTLAALPPNTRDRLVKDGLIAPTIQMILRRSQKQIHTRDDYFTGAAHPTVFDADQLVPERMIGLAAALRPETIPPMVHLSVEEEDFSPEAGLGGLSERLFDTPSAIARIWRGTGWQHQMVISAKDTQDPNGRALTFRWVLLRGDAGRIRIEPMDATGTTARLTINWQDVRLIDGVPDRLTSRVDIGIFASNGAQDSAPAFVSISLPTQEQRAYVPGPDGVMRVVSIDYDALERKAVYDPLLHWSAPWRDVYAYDAAGKPDGWQRIGKDGTTQFNAAQAAALNYRINRSKTARPVLEVLSVGKEGSGADMPPTPDTETLPN